jgi:aminopeptidase N
VIEATQAYDAAKKTFTLTLKQHTPTTPGQPQEGKLPLMIPVVTGLLSATTGAEIAPSRVLVLTEAEQTFVFDNVPEKPVASVLRDFSAPVKLRLAQTDEELATIMAHDTDPFNRWDAGNRLATALILRWG